MRRLAHGGRIRRDRSIQFEFNGRRYGGFEGDTLASALMAAGERMVARSWKYHRPRGLLSAGVEEPNALVQLFEGARTVPNARMTEVSIVDGLKARSVHANPSIEFDLGAINGWFSRLLPAGFYYKTFMASQGVWHFFEKHIRRASGLGSSPQVPDPDRYDKRFVHADVLVVGAGMAGLSAARAAAQSGARVILCDEQSEPGGWLLSSDQTVDGLAAPQWADQTVSQLRAMPHVQVLARTTAFGYHDHDFVTLVERRADHLPEGAKPAARERLWRVRAKKVVLCTGAHERPLVFAHNDLPGVMLASAVSTYVRRYAVLPGDRAIVFTNNDAAYDAALALHNAGAHVQVIDARESAEGSLSAKARQAGVEILEAHVVTQAHGKRGVTGVTVQRLTAEGRLSGTPRNLPCDLLATSGGFSAVIHLHSQAGSKAVWNDALATFLPGKPAQSESSAGACNGTQTLREAAQAGTAAGWAAAQGSQSHLRPSGTQNSSKAPSPAHIEEAVSGPLRPLWLVPHPAGASRAPKQFVDFQNDVCAADLLLAVREGFESIEHVKRYTALGFGTDQGKTGNINGMGIVAQALAALSSGGHHHLATQLHPRHVWRVGGHGTRRHLRAGSHHCDP